jgi:two-component system, OmpR family, phosphate regulon sensor histidine kinase PhoR
VNRQNFRIILSLGIVAIVGLVSTQVYWLNKAMGLKAEQFEAKVRTVLAIVADQVTGRQGAARSPAAIEKIGDLQFIVYTNDILDPNVLSTHLRREFELYGIERDFVYKLYDCSNRANVCEDYVMFTGSDGGAFESRLVPWPEENLDQYYFGVYFPDTDGFVLGSLGIWTYSSIALLFVAAFFLYAVIELTRQRRLSEIQRDFIDAMTHEFKTPLTTISLVGEALQNPALISKPEKLERYSLMIRQEVARLKAHVETILTNAQEYERKPNLTLELLKPGDILLEIQSAFAERAAQVGMQIEVLLPLEGRIMADRIHVYNMLSTLVDNALKYASPHGRPCKILLASFVARGTTVIEVSDTGIGMDAKTSRSAGSKFFRARHDADAPKGFGLGLFYVKTMMRNHKGRVKLKSSLNVGTTVSLLFPTQ